MVEGFKLLGLAEIPGPAHESRIVRMWQSIKAPFRDDETPWCAAFVGHCLESSALRSSRSAAARSYLAWGQKLDAPVPGCVVVLNRPGSSWSGHVGFAVSRDDRGRIGLLGGNQGNRVSVAFFDPARVIGCRWPADAGPMWPAGSQPLPKAASVALLDPTSENEA